MNHLVVRSDPRKEQACVVCGTVIRQRWNYEHCSHECVLVGELRLNLIMHDLIGWL